MHFHEKLTFCEICVYIVPSDSYTVVSSQILAQCHRRGGGIQEINQNYEKS